MQRKVTRLVAQRIVFWIPVQILMFLKLSGVALPFAACVYASVTIMAFCVAFDIFTFSTIPEKLTTLYSTYTKKMSVNKN